MAVQGDFYEHMAALRRSFKELKIDGEVVAVKRRGDVIGLSAVVIPGGESTVIGRLMERSGLIMELRERVEDGLPILGTCAGAILMAKECYDKRLGEVDQPLLSVMDVRVARNAYGRQRESFEVDLEFDELGVVRGVFIRAPVIEKVLSDDVEPLCTYRGHIVAARQGCRLALTFHPELLEKPILHKYFIDRFILNSS